MSLIIENKKIDFKSNLEFIIIPLSIILSGFKIYGYSVSFLIFLPYFIFNYKKYFVFIKEYKKQNKLILIFLAYLIFMSIIGAFFVFDLRVLIFWIPFFITLGFTYLHNKILLINNSFYREKFNEIIYISGLIYFVIYLIMNILSLISFGNEYEIQTNFWIGSSAAFHLSSIFLSSLYILWQKINFRIKSHYLLSTLFFTFIVSFNSSRLGFLYLVIFSLAVLLKCSTKKLFIKAIILGTLISNTYFYTSHILVFTGKEAVNMRDTLVDVTRGVPQFDKAIDEKSEVKFSGDGDRIFEFMVGIKKFQKTNILNKIVGTGWYSSRKTINDVRNEMIQKYSSKLSEFSGIKPTTTASLQGGVALILDTGLLGLTFIGYFYLIAFKLILKTFEDLIAKVFIISMLGMNLFCLMIGYPYANLIYWLIFLPGGIFQFNKNAIED